jgi:hypothetical protein
LIPLTRNSRATAWFAALEHLLRSPQHIEHNLFLEILHPMRLDAIDQRIEHDVDALLRSAQLNPLSTVAGTIFPASAYLQYGPRGVYDVYPDEEYPEIESDLQWGTYAHRLVRWPTANGGFINPLEKCIEKIQVELATAGPKRACYELSLSDPALDIPIYDSAADRSRHEGGPCLSHLSFKIRNRTELLLTALYRSHWYVTRALGNLLGLAQLQAFVCEQTRLFPGPLVCVSTFAKIDTGRGYGIHAVRDLVECVRADMPSADLEPARA